MKAIVSIVGKDHVGIIAGVCALLASKNVNILDIHQTVMEGYFTMTMLVDISESCPFENLRADLMAHGENEGLAIRIQREDIFNAMYNV